MVDDGLGTAGYSEEVEGRWMLLVVLIACRWPTVEGILYGACRG